MATTNTTPAQTTDQTPAPVDPVLKALQAQQAQLEAQAKIQASQQALLTGALPVSTAAPLPGAFTVTGSNPFPSQELAYKGLAEVAAKVAAKVKEKVTTSGPVLIYDQAEINSLINYKAVTKILAALQTQVNSIETEFNNNLHPKAQVLLTLAKGGEADEGKKAFAGILIPGLALAGLKTASDLIGMFRTNTNIAFSSFTTDDAALVAAVAETLTSEKLEVFEPGVMPLGATDTNSPFMDQLSSIQTAMMTMQETAAVDQVRVQGVSDALGAYIQADQVSQANQDQTAAETDPAKRATLQTKQAGLDRARDAAKQSALSMLGAPAGSVLDVAAGIAMKAQRDQFVKVLAAFVTSIAPTATAFGALQTSLTAVTSTGSTTLMAILRAEALSAAAKKEGAAILMVKTSVLGGSVVTRTNLFTGGKLLYTGGAIVNFTLFNTNGAVMISGVMVGNTEPVRDKF